MTTHAQVMHVTCKTCVQIRRCTKGMTFEQSKMQNDERAVALEIGNCSKRPHVCTISIIAQFVWSKSSFIDMHLTYEVVCLQA